MEKTISRRLFLQATGASALSAFLPDISGARASNKFASLEDLTGTNEMIRTIITANDVGDYDFNPKDDGSFTIRADIGPCSIRYEGNGYEPRGYLTISSEGNYWKISSQDSSVTNFIAHNPSYVFKEFDPKNANPLFKRIQELLNIPVCKQNSKGEDLTFLVDYLLGKVTSVENFKVKTIKGIDSRGGINASYEEGDLKVDYRLRRWGPGCGCSTAYTSVDFQIRDGENIFQFWRSYDKKGKERFCNVDVIRISDDSVSQSCFSTKKGKNLEFPKGVYNRESAMGILDKAEMVGQYLTDFMNTTIKNT